ncbi:sulfatase [Verrucomicrobiales bacterium BCK34]|nr:sulfatase [Verrucomicrobiales bacterium BCK34]
MLNKKSQNQFHCRPLFALILISLGLIAPLSLKATESDRPNFVIFIVDDLNDYVGALGGHPNASTPNIDRLAEQGVLFTNAHCNSPVCNPSRTSLFTGLRPTTTGITSNRFGWFREVPGFEEVKTFPVALEEEGYTTFGFGKTIHAKKIDHPDSKWSNSLQYPEFQHWNSYNYGPILKIRDHLNFKMGDHLTDWGGLPKSEQYPLASHDSTIADRTINVLLDEHDSPFLVACGFYRPHTPLYAQQQWFDLHPLEGIALPEAPADDRDDLVYFGKRGHKRTPAEIEAPGLWNHQWITKNGKAKAIQQAYLASTSSMDAEVGRVLDALEESPHRDNTYVILFSDHGWNLGEKEHWGKAALWEQTTRVPFIVSGPGVPEGAVSNQPVELLSLYPTVIDLAGLAPPPHIEGHSLRPLLKTPEAGWNHSALTTFSDHHALRTVRHRYIRYSDGSEELYDHTSDPDEFDNLAVSAAGNSEVEETLARLQNEMDEILDRSKQDE